MLRTYQPKKLHRKKEHGFRKRMADRNGRRYCLAAGQREESIFLINGVFFINIG